jgi:Ser/Thr protein kinase RdoA (MazF antagonist)
VTGSDESTLAYAELQPDDILTTMEELGFRCDGRFLALNSYENRVYQIGIPGAGVMRLYMRNIVSALNLLMRISLLSRPSR